MPSNNNINGSLDALPMSPCTDGSLGFDSHFMDCNPVKALEEHPYSSVMEHTAAEEDKVEEEQGGLIEEQVEEEPAHEKSEDEEDLEHEQSEDEDEVEDLTEKTSTLTVSSENSEVLTTSANPAEPEVMASGIPNRSVKVGMLTHVQARGLSAASLALKKKQAAEEAAAAIKAHAVEVPETDSIANRIRIFGGASAPGRMGGLRKLGVRDMVQKFKDVEDQSQDVIAHVNRGHNDAEPRGVCSAYSLSTASRPIRPTPRRKMSHELGENEAREVVKAFGGMAAKHEDNRLGVDQESVQSVRNAKSIFETLARTEGGAQV